VAATKTSPSVNGSGVAAKAKGAGDSVATAARSAKRPAIVAGAAAAGLAGGIALGSRMSWRRKSTLERVADAAGQLARELGSATKQVAATTDDVHEIRDQLDKANRQSPLEVVLDGLTHRRGAHKRES
jgi:hypothetical protein